jgi:EAL domain-containing protein (putative c-di-GMP-specific phosphodiesterase class I)/GGDEF domain-containing protein
MSISFEEDRLNALHDFALLDTPASESFDRITRMASLLVGASIAAISLTDRDWQWFKSRIGMDSREMSRLQAPCAEISRSGSFLLVPDLLDDPRFADSPLARAGIRFYAGAPLVTRDGYGLGAMCVLDPLPRTISAEQIQSLKDLAAMVMVQIELQHDFGRTDPLSGLPNRHQMADDLVDLAGREPGASYTTLLIDLTDTRHFDQIASVLGTSYVDVLVRASSRAIQDVLGRRARLYHVGIASYAALLDETAGPSWHEAISALTVRLRQPVWCNGIPVAVRFVYGISSFRLGETSPADALRTAISAAHDAREAELDHSIYSPARDQANRRRFTLLTDIPAALEASDQLRLVYQPRVDLRTGACVSVEALLRWQHPSLGNIPPGEFIPLVEQTALVRPVTAWVIHTALEQAQAWQVAGRTLRISINVSAPNLEEQDFAQRLSDALDRRGLPPAAIELEFTESALIRNGSHVMGQLAAIKALGIEIAIDDFGSGYSTFSYLRRLPASTVKLDQSFIRGIAGSTRDQMLVRSMIGMAHELGYRVVAEGVETREALDFLADAACDEVQGYFISHPVPVDTLDDWLRQDSLAAGQADQPPLVTV